MVTRTRQPKWLTTERKTELLSLFASSRGLCVYGDDNCLEPSHHYEYYIEKLIGNWKLDDREVARLDWLLERQAMHSSGEARYRAGRFGSIGTEIYHGSQPLFFIEALGMSGVKLEPFAKVKLSSSMLRLNVDIGSSLKGLSKNKKRKALRHGKPLPHRTQAEVSRLVFQAVRDYLRS
ncbi:MAG: hypothetical protein Q8O55_03915 [Dehalococcoidales bacterium]|nr:hypothetical protein [Dehalococcoidales bacterium]